MALLDSPLFATSRINSTLKLCCETITRVRADFCKCFDCEVGIMPGIKVRIQEYFDLSPTPKSV